MGSNRFTYGKKYRCIFLMDLQLHLLKLGSDASFLSDRLADLPFGSSLKLSYEVFRKQSLYENERREELLPDSIFRFFWL